MRSERLGRLLYWLLWPALYVYLRLGARTRVVVLASNTHILLVRSWLSDGRYKLPGGGLHRGEQSAVGAVREVLEETSVPLLPEQCRLLASGLLYDGRLQFSAHLFVARLDQPIQAHVHGREIITAEWVPLEQLPQLDCKPEVAQALKLLDDR